MHAIPSFVQLQSSSTAERPVASGSDAEDHAGAAASLVALWESLVCTTVCVSVLRRNACAIRSVCTACAIGTGLLDRSAAVVVPGHAVADAAGAGDLEIGAGMDQFRDGDVGSIVAAVAVLGGVADGRNRQRAEADGLPG